MLAVLATAGLYERSGDWLYDVGLPGKSGVSGGIVTISPGKGGLGTYSPRLDAAGNSVRGTAVTRTLSQALGLNVFASSVSPTFAARSRQPLAGSGGESVAVGEEGAVVPVADVDGHL